MDILTLDTQGKRTQNRTEQNFTHNVLPDIIKAKTNQNNKCDQGKLIPNQQETRHDS